MQPSNSTRNLTAWLAAFFLVVMGAKLWTIQVFGTNLPFWDQWDEARLLFKPWLEGGLTWEAFFRAHNEHRIFFTRVLDLFELKLNGTWDTLLQMVVNALIHAVFGCGLALAIWRFTGRKHAGMICFLLLPFFSLPFDSENTVHGFQSQMYFLSIFSVAAIVGLGFGKPCGLAWFGGLAAAVMAIFTMGSGFMAAVAVTGLICLRMFKQRAVTREDVLTILCGLAVTALGLALKVTVDEPYRAKTLADFLAAMLTNLAWPLSSRPAMALVFCAPLAITFVRYLQPDFKNSRAAEFVLALGLWGLLQSAALAYVRATLVGSSRYCDMLSTLPMAGIASLFVLAGNIDFRRLPRQLAPLLAIGWASVLLIGTWKISQSTMTGYLYWARMWGLLETENVRAFIASDDPNWLRSKMSLAIPYWSSDWLTDLLREPKILSILPPDARPPLKLELDDSSGASFVADGFAPGLPSQPFTQTWGDFSTNRTTAARQFVSRPMSTALPRLMLQFGCGPTNGLSAQLAESSGNTTTLRLENSGRWQTLIVDAPKNPFRLKITDQNPDSWIAVGDIKEYGRWSHFFQILLDHAVAVLFCGLGLFVLLAGYETSSYGIKLFNEGFIWLLILCVALLALAGTWSWRNYDSTEYALALHKKWAADFASVGHPGRAELHLREALWLRPDDDEARKELGILKAHGVTESLPEKLK